jgi:haloalkane dehalogenase
MTPKQMQQAIQVSIEQGNTDLIKPPEDAVKNKLETPESVFQGLDKIGFGYKTKAVDWHGLTMSYIDEQRVYDVATGKIAYGEPSKDEVFLCLHGQPMWSFLYRKMIPVFLSNGIGEPTYSVDFPNEPPRTLVRNRVICPDLIGFGRSSKPTNDDVYTYEFHISSLVNFILALGLYKQTDGSMTRRVTLVVQDWGGLLGLVIPSLFPKDSPFTRLIVMNTILPIGRPAGKGFLAWREYAGGKDYNIGKMVKRGHPHISKEEEDAYNLPWPSERFKAGVRKFPLLVPLAPENPADAFGVFARSFYQNEFWNRPGARMFFCFGLKDPVFGTQEVTRTLLADLGGTEKMTIIQHAHAGHFVQETGGAFVAQQAMLAFNSVDRVHIPKNKL